MPVLKFTFWLWQARGQKAWDDHVKRYKAQSDVSNYNLTGGWSMVQLFNSKLNLHIQKLPWLLWKQPADISEQCPKTVCYYYYDSDAKIEKVLDEEINILYAVWEDNSLPHECKYEALHHTRNIYADEWQSSGDRV